MKILKYTLTALFAVALLGSCEKDKTTPVQPSTIKNIATTARAGNIKITWVKEEPVTFEYIKVSYFDKLQKKEMVRLVSRYSDSIVIPNTRAKYGDYTFTLQPFSITNTAGEIYTLKGVSGKARADTISVVETKLDLQEHNLTSNEIQPSREPKFLLDGNTATFFHSRWQNPKYEVHYLEINLDKPISNGFKFFYSGRDNGNNYPTEIRIEASTNKEQWDVLETISEGLPNPTGTLASYTSPSIWFKNKPSYQHFRLVVTKTKDGQRWFVMSEFGMWQLNPVVIDPEAPAEGD